MIEAEFTPDQAKEIIIWLVHLLGGDVTITTDAQFWDDNFPNAKLLVDHDGAGNPILSLKYM
jgi:hypothetical protein